MLTQRIYFISVAKLIAMPNLSGKTMIALASKYLKCSGLRTTNIPWWSQAFSFQQQSSCIVETTLSMYNYNNATIHNSINFFSFFVDTVYGYLSDSHNTLAELASGFELNDISLHATASSFTSYSTFLSPNSQELLKVFFPSWKWKLMISGLGIRANLETQESVGTFYIIGLYNLHNPSLIKISPRQMQTKFPQFFLITLWPNLYARNLSSPNISFPKPLG